MKFLIVLAAVVSFAAGAYAHSYISYVFQPKVVVKPTVKEATDAVRRELNTGDIGIAVEKIGECLLGNTLREIGQFPGIICMTSAVLTPGKPPTDQVMGFALLDGRWVVPFLDVKACACWFGEKCTEGEE